MLEHASPAPSDRKRPAAGPSPSAKRRKSGGLDLSIPSTHVGQPPVIAKRAAAPKPVASTLNSEVDQHYRNAVSKLGTFVQQAVDLLDQCSSWEQFVVTSHGPTHLQDGLENLNHPAAEYLASLQEHGCPVYYDDPDWTLEELDAAVEKGCNRSAEFHRDFIAEEMVEFGESGFWTILPYDRVRHLPGLRLSPAQIKEERDRKPRFISDHKSWGANAHTLKIAPPEAMQFGGALYRLAYHIRHADPAHGPVYIAKFDIKDGFYRVHLRPEHCVRLAVVLPKYPGLPPLVAVPLSLTMGWTESPPTFTSVTESACDVTNNRMYRRHAPPHRLESLSEPLDEDLPALGPRLPATQEPSSPSSPTE